MSSRATADRHLCCTELLQRLQETRHDTCLMHRSANCQTSVVQKRCQTIAPVLRETCQSYFCWKMPILSSLWPSVSLSERGRPRKRGSRRLPFSLTEFFPRGSMKKKRPG